MNDQARQAEPAAIDEAAVVRWLLRHPDFFAKHDALLARIEIPHHSGAAVSLVERQITVLRERAEKAERKLNELIALARTNERLARRTHLFALRLIEAQSLESLLDGVRDCLHSDFGAERVTLRLIDGPEGRNLASDPDTFVAPDLPELEQFEELFERRRARSGRLAPAQALYLFGKGAANLGSAALVPLSAGQRRLGLLAIASEDPRRFHPTMGVLFLNYLGEMLSSALRRYLP